ncbi:MAG: type II toxin-antitoxin system RelE/ParE family toxin [Syntrophobacteraceae bacterium]
MDRPAQERIRKYLLERIAPASDARKLGDPLKSNLTGLWKHRVGDYRIVAEIRDKEVLVLMVRIDHRSNVYGGH